MEIKEFIAILEKSHFSLSVDNGKLNLNGDRNKLTKAEIEAIKRNKDVIDYIKTNKNELIEYVSVFSAATAVKKPKDVSSIYRLSGLQQGMLFHGLYDDETEAHKIQFICDLIEVNTKLFSQSWSYLLKKHCVLRSGFYYDAFSVPVQCVYRQVELPVTLLDYPHLTDAEQAAALQNYEEADRIKGFNFKAAPLMRLALLRVSRERYRMIWTSHHILFDGWSLSRLMEEFLNTYELLISGKPVNQAEEDRYEDYIRYIERKDRNKEEAYWRNYLRNVQQSTLLPFIETTTERNKGTGIYSSQHVQLDIATTAGIQQYAQQNRLTVNTIVQAAWAYLLHRYTGNNDVTYGVIVSGRPDDLPGVEQRVGMYINTLPLHTAINGEQKITEWLAQLQAEQVASRQYQYTPLYETQQWTGVKGDLFDSLLVFENYPVSKMIGERQWTLKVENVRMHDPANYPLTILINSAAQIHINFHYNASLLEKSYIREILGHFEQVLLQIAANPEGHIKDIELLKAAELQQLVFELNNTSAAYPDDTTIAHLFEKQAAKTPDREAVVFEGELLTYKELDERSNQLAHYLKSKGVQEQTLVPICVERSLQMIVGVLGILKAGAVYVPIDPEYPAARIRYMLEDTGAAVVISSRGSKSKLELTAQTVQIIEIDHHWPAIATRPATHIQTDALPHHLAYILYTSGSTGTPKGVQMPGSNLVNLLRWQESQFEKGERRVLQFASLNFDVSFQEIFSTLCFGSSLYLVSEHRRKDMAELVKDMDKYQLTHLFVPYIVLKSLAEYMMPLNRGMPGVQEIMVAGEQLKLTPDIDDLLNRNNIKLINQYGPTETHVVSSYRITDTYVSNPLPPIGKPIDNVQLYVLDSGKRVCPAGVAGELYIGGAQVAAGYLNRNELTAERFIPNPFDAESGTLMYKTGDLARWLPDGNIEYLGRIDEQVKIRGYRVEPGEIETILQQHPQVKRAVVLAKGDNSGNQRLVGYVVSQGAFDQEAITSYLKEELPAYMVPALWVSLENFPISPNGKIDRRALPDPDISAANRQAYVAPSNELEMELSLIFQELLGIEKVGVQDNFFELGGHSLLAMRAVSAIRRKVHKELTVKDLFEKPTIAALHHFIKSKSNGIVQLAIQAGPRPANIPLSFSQERLWFIDQLEGTVQYHIPAVLHVQGIVSIPALEYAFQYITNRHEVIRTVIRQESGQPYQFILENAVPVLTVTDGTHYQNNRAGLEQEIQQFIQAPFDLGSDLMIRAGLIRLSEENHVLMVAMHHIASDGWSISIIVKELVELYETCLQKRLPNLEPLKLQYADYAIWQRNYLQGELLDKKLAYWKEKLNGVAPLELPLDFDRPAVQRTDGAVAEMTIDKELTEKLHQLSKQQGASLFMTLLSAFNVLLNRYSGQEDICVGTPVANRTHQEVEPLIGFFVNTLALRNEVKSTILFTDLLQQVKDNTLQAYQHQDVPFEKVVDSVVKERDLSRTPLFQVLFVLHNTPEVPALRLGNLTLTSESFDHHSAKFDLTVNIITADTGLRVFASYSTAIFSSATIQRMLLHFVQLLQSIVAWPQQKIGAIPMLSNGEKDQLLQQFNDTPEPVDRDTNIISLFQKQAALTPGAVALVFGKQQLTYAELDKRSNQLASYLQSRGVKRESIVPVCLHKSPELIVGILGILKAGGAYVPIDPAYPNERIRFMLQDTGVELLLTTETHTGSLSAILGKEKMIALDEDWNQISSFSDTLPTPEISPEQLAYVLYTSGSAGKPKGVAVQHNSLANHLLWFNKQYGLTNTDSSLLISSFSFDGSMTATWPVLLSGGTLHLPEEDSFDPTVTLQYIAEHAITYLKTLPGIFGALIEQPIFKDKKLCASLRLIIVGGERMRIMDFKTYMNVYPDIVFANHYGPTECTISSSFYLINKSNIDRINHQSLIGKPVANTCLYIVSEEGQLHPTGIPGEIFIAGDGVARGYRNQPALTAEKFVINPFSNTPGAMMYKTGDMGKQWADGNVEYLGRKDEQVKVRGYRIELGEIEHVLLQSGLVKKAVVTAKTDELYHENLIGYIVPTTVLDREKITAYLKQQLPAYMIPALWVALDELPLSPNGKVDRHALPDPDVRAGLAAKAFVAPRNETEKIIAGIWMDLLQLTEVSIHDNFFQLGGHSFIAMRVLSALRKQAGASLSVKDIFLYPTIAALAANINKEKQHSAIPANEIHKRPEHIPLSYNQQQLWFIDQLSGSVQYHIPSVIHLEGTVHIDTLRNTCYRLVQRHEILRTVIRNFEGTPYQVVRNADAVEIPLTIVNGSAYKNNEPALQSFIQSIIQQPFDLSSDCLMRPTLIQLDEKRHVLVITMHHLITDAWSASILVNEMVELYQSEQDKKPSSLQPLPLQYADYAIWQQKWMAGEVLEMELDYWRTKLSGVEPLQLPADYKRPAIQSTRGKCITFTLDHEIVAGLQQLSHREEATLFMTLLAVFKVLLYRYSGQEDICVGTGIAGREQQELEKLIGYFLNILALRTEFSGNDSFVGLLKKVKATTLEAFDHRHVPFNKVVDAVVVQRDSSRSPLFQVVFTLNNTPGNPPIDLGELTLTTQPPGHTTSKFDLTFFLTETPGGINGTVEYCTDLFSGDTIERMVMHFKELVSAIVKNPHQQVNVLPMMTGAEEQQLLVEFNRNNEKQTITGTLVELFEQHANKAPDKPAIMYKQDRYSYKEFNESANCLAHYLIACGVQPQMLVPVCIEQSADMLIAIMAILKTGATYVPVDPEFPEKRIKYLLEDTAATIVVSNSKHANKLRNNGQLQIIETDTSAAEIQKQSYQNVAVSIQPHQAAYIIYTSGSTGTPKGVPVSHGAILNYLLNDQTKYITDSNNTGSFIHLSYTFDASLTAMFMPLVYGKSVVIGSGKPVEIFEDENCRKYAPYDFIKVTPAHLELLQSSITDNHGNLLTKRLVVGGEALHYGQFAYFIDRGIAIDIVNEYGPTEASVGCSTYAFNTVSDQKKIKNGIPIGKPVTNVDMYMVSAGNALVPIGVAGEICISGAGLANGYFNLPQLTAEKFVPNPFSKVEGAKMYKTGDRGRWLPDGNMEYLGRKDDQVKIRGYRIEPGEIEAALMAIKGISNATVAVRENEQGNSKKLHAYLQVDKERLPLLHNYLRLLKDKQINKGELNILPNRLPIFNSNLNEVRFLYKEIFEDHCYLKNGITLQPGSCVIDVGANAGFFTVFLNVLSKDIKVYSFEPIPDVFHYLEANRQLYNVQGKAFQLALLDEEAEVEFTWYPGVSIVSGIKNDREEVREVVKSYIRNSSTENFAAEEIESMLEVKLENRQIKVKTKTLSQVIAEEEIEWIDLLKVDVENSEHLVLNGIKEEDWDKIGTAIIEIHDADNRLQQIKELLERKGFRTQVEKEAMLSGDDILYNLFAIKESAATGISAMGGNDTERATEWMNAEELEDMVRANIQESLPDYMMPAQFILLDQFTLTSSGKIDKNALPAVDIAQPENQHTDVPLSDLQKGMVQIWKELLETESLGIHDNFFNAGGDSLLAVRVIAAMRKGLEIEIRIREIFDHPTIAGLAAFISGRQTSMLLPGVFTKQARPPFIPLSFSQDRLWFIDKLQGSTQYHIPAVLRLKGDLNKPALKFALQSIVNRHEVLRTVIWENNGSGYQLILPKNSWNWQETDGAGYDANEALLQAYIEQFITAPFNLSKDQMLRAEIIRLHADEHILAVTMHHIASDGWSVAIIIKEVMAFYDAFTRNKPAPLPELNIQFADYAIWQKAYLQGEVLQQKLAYWKSTLHGVAVLQLPYDHALENSDAKGAIAKFEVDAAITEKLQQISREQGATLFMTLLAAFKVLMYRYTGQGDICVGTSVAGRQLREFEDLIGFFINAIALRTEVKPDESFTGLLKRVSMTTLDAYEHQDVPFEKVVDAVLKERDTSTTPLFQVVFAMQNTIETPVLQFGEIQLSAESYAQETAKFNLVCNVAETGNGLSGSIQYATDKFSRQTVEQMIGIFKKLLETISGSAEQQIKDLIKTKKEESIQVMNRKAADTNYLWDKTMVDLFEEQAALSPDAIAIMYEEQQLTYRQLNEWSNKVARYLVSAGVEEEDLVLICMDRSPELYVGILGILKAGGAFLPVDPVNPEERIQYMQQDSKAAFAITSTETAAIFEDVKKIEVVELGKEHADINKQSANNLHTEIEPNHLAYVIYTSGSTGKPKGVSIMHRSNVNMSTDQVRQFGIMASDKVLQFASISFDAFVSEVFMAFYAGATLVVMKKEVMQNTGNFTAAMRENKVSVVTLPPVYLKALPNDDLHFLRVIITAGEAPDVKQAALLSRYVDYYNAYGPTECAVCASIYKVTPEDATRVRMPIGKPIANTNMYVLDEDLHELPAGMQGEIYVSGAGLAKGYLRRPELTAEKFIPNPFGTGRKLYKTGDLGRWLNDGNLEFLGRKDDQIKLRGYRVELGEIEHTLLENDEIENCAVVVHELKDDTRLIAYYQPKSKITLWPSVAEFYVYDDLLYKTMAGDEKRNARYRNAFRKVVKDKIILEIGPGSEAILSRIAIEEGAKKVYAVELLEESYLKAKTTVESLGLQDQIIVIHGDITKVELPEKADYCISEIVGAIGGSEGAAVLINSSRRLLKDPSHMIPTRSLTNIAAVTLPEDQFDYSFEQLGAYYVSKIFEAAGRPFDLRLYLSGLPAKNSISTSGTFEDLDYTKECPLEEEHTVRLLFEQDAFMHGFIVWLNLYCDNDEVIDTLSGKYTWLPIYLPVFDAGEKVAAGDYIEAKISRKLSANGLNPDFVIQGTLVRNHLPPRNFIYESFNLTTSFRGNHFYRKVFENEAVKITEKIGKDSLKAYLNARLPDYMVPSLFVELDEFPVTISGKIDRKALPAPDTTAEMAEQYLAPRNEVEKALVDIWAEILEVENIGIHDDFFESGGHSLMAIRLISLIRQRLNIELPIGEVFENPTIAQLAGRLENPVLPSGTPALSVQVRPEYIPLSFAQERLFFIDQLEGSVSYHLPAVLRLTGDVNKAALQIALQTIVTRHEVLRTVIRVHDGQGYQQVMNEGSWEMEFVDGAKFGSGKGSLQQYIAAFLKRPFNLSADHNIKACLISLDNGEHLLVVTVHHIASDGWSLTLMVKELVELYIAYNEGRAARLPALPVQYADYAIWQRAYLRGELLDKKLDYWKKKLEGITALQLPADYPRPPVQSSNGAVKRFRLNTELTEALNSLARRHDVTLFMTLLAAFKVLLHQYSSQEDICIGTPVANRLNREVETLVGFFVNTLVIRSLVDGDETFDVLLQRVKATTLEAYEYGDVPFEKVVDAVMKERDRSRHPLFQVMFMLQNTPDVPEARLGNVQLTNEPFSATTAKFDLSFALVETTAGIVGAVEYCTDLFSEQTIVLMIGHFEVLLNAIVANPAEKVDQLSMLTEAEKQQLIAFNDTDKAYPADTTIIGLFEEQVQKTPGATALIFGEQQLTYQQLNERSNQVAHHLLQKGVTAEMLVPVCLERSLNMLVSIFGILKAGAAYVPVDPQYPQERINYMLEDIAASVMIGSTGSKKPGVTIEIIDINGEWEIICKASTGNPGVRVTPNNLAYIIYTSGSTGKPKGVMIEHGNLAAFINWCKDEFSNSPFEIAYATTSMCFDLSVFEFFYPLVTGKKIRILENGTAIGKYLPLDKQVLTNSVPVVMEHLLKEGADLGNITVVNMAGEPISQQVQLGLDMTRMEVRNLYGPTEDTTYSTVFRLKKDEPVLIGKPITNTRIYITNKAGQPVPIGVPGQLCISGAGVTRGYLNQAELTAEKFIKDPIHERGGRLYKTGDVARWLADGNIEYLGRMDNQVKVRGYRIELGEIETAIQQSSLVSEAVVTAIPDSGGSKRLVGYIVPKDTFDKQALTACLQSKLPGYMVPAVWVQLQALPLTPNGKIDRKALPHPESGDLDTPEYVAPRNETEQRLATIWQELLGIERTGIHANFFELGGHSLLAMRMISVIRTKLQVETAIRDLFIHPTIATLAAHLSLQKTGNILPPVTVQARPPYIPLSFSQERLFFIHQLGGSTQYHIPLVLRLKGRLDVSLLKHTLQTIVNRHEVLRTVLDQQDGEGYQLVLEKDDLKIALIEDPTLLTDTALLKASIYQQINQPFDLSRDHMLRASLIRLSEQEHILVATLHHIAADGWSLSLLVKELIEIYSAGVEERSALFNLPALQYADYAIWQRTCISGEVLQEKQAYWKTKLDGIQPLQLPTDYTRPVIQSAKGAVMPFQFNKQLTGELNGLSRQHGVTLFMTLLAGLNVLLHRYSGQEDICIGTPVANRPGRELEDMIGLFVNTLALRTGVMGDLSFTHLLQQVKSTALEAYEHQEIPFEKVVDLVIRERDRSRHPLFQVMFVLQNTPEIPRLKLGNVALTNETFEQHTSRFDLTFAMAETEFGLQGSLEYCTDLFNEGTITNMMGHFENLLTSIVQDPLQQVNTLAMLPEAEKNRLKIDFNAASVAYPKDKTIAGLFEEQAEKMPDQIAVVFEGQSLTYRQLDERSSQLAHYLRSRGVKEETLVPICVERSLDMIAGIIGILKAGGVYVPIDPEYPPGRISYILQDTGATLVVSSSKTSGKLVLSQAAIELIELDTLEKVITSGPTDKITLQSKPHHLIFILYTSGSTGVPKGVKMPDSNMVNLLYWQEDQFSHHRRRVLQFASLGFDASFHEIFSTLCFGNTLYLITEERRKDMAELVKDITQYSLTHIHIPYIVLKSLAEHIRTMEYNYLGLQQIITAGEQLKLTADIKELLEKNTIQLVNQYGPTEAHVVSSYTIERKDYEQALPPIGKPVSNVQLYVLNKVGALSGIGIPGELYIAGAQVAAGYLNREDLTAEKFIKNTVDANGPVMYKTGDLARWLPDGNLEYLGRIDDQVKIRGNRVELGEIETVLQQHEQVRQAVVLAKEDSSGTRRLVGYIVPQEAFDRDAMVAWLKNRLPEYMVPALWVVLESLPISPNGKIDRKKLPNPDLNTASKHEYVAPRNKQEAELVVIWQDLLGVEKVGIHDNFFELGGHSLLAMKMVAHLKKRVGITIPVQVLFQFTTVSDLSKYLEWESETSNTAVDDDAAFEVINI